MKRTRRVISFLLALVMVLGIMPPTAVRAEETEAAVATILTTEETTIPTEATGEQIQETTFPAEIETEATWETTIPMETVTEPVEETTVPTETEPESTEETEESLEVTIPVTGSDTNETLLAAESVIAKGSCGNSMTWVLDGEGTLTISGTGEMRYYLDYSSFPWHSWRDRVLSVVIEDGITYVSDKAFMNMTNLTTAYIGDSVTHLCRYAFSRCSSLKTVHLPESLKWLQTGTFFQCTSLEYISIPDNTTSIQEFAFNGCKNLKKILLPAKLERIGNDAFVGCELLTELKLPEGVNYLGASFVEGCTSLESVYFRGDIPRVSDYTFEGVDIVAYYPEDNATWTADVLQDYGGNITWIPYDIHNSDSVFINNVSVICYLNENDSALPNEKFVLADENTTATISDARHTAALGQFTLFGKANDLVTFQREGYLTRTFRLKDLVKNNRVYLQKESAAPVIYGLWMGNTDILHTEVGMDYASEKKVTLTPEIDWGSSRMDGLCLYQEGKAQYLKEGENTLALASAFDINKEIYLFFFF